MNSNSIEGIRDINGKLVADFDIDSVTDLLQLTKQELYSSLFNGHVYRFGYQFKEDVSSKDRTRVIHWIKGLDNDKPTEKELHKLISKPLGLFNKEIPFSQFDCVIYPDSQRTQLVKKIVSVVNTYLQHDIARPFYSLVKSLPQNVQFDWDLFNTEYPQLEDKNRHNQMVQTIINILDKVHSLDYFSISKSIPPKYRAFIKNYLSFSDSASKEAFNKLLAKKILIIDDINTTGSTLYEMLRIVEAVNTDSEIYIFTLIGKEQE